MRLAPVKIYTIGHRIETKTYVVLIFVVEVSLVPHGLAETEGEDDAQNLDPALQNFFCVAI